MPSEFGKLINLKTLFLIGNQLTSFPVEKFVEPATLFQGIILKIVFIGAFIKGIQSALEAKKFLTELEKFKAVPVGEE